MEEMERGEKEGIKRRVHERERERVIIVLMMWSKLTSERQQW